MYIIYENNMSPQTPDSLACFDHFVDARKDTLEQWVFLLFLTKKKRILKDAKVGIVLVMMAPFMHHLKRRVHKVMHK